MNLTNFLRTGKFLKLKIGLSEKKIYSVFKKKYLGKKNYFNKLNKDEGFSYYYDGLQIIIVDSKIHTIGFDLTYNPITLLNNIFIYPETSLELIMKYLDIADIEWCFEKRNHYGRELTIRTEGNVLISCIYDKGNYRLSKFQISKDVFD
ncbi:MULTISPECIES: hypothetical protein [unclassified Snodgrassella]|uniref:hypothetical protein n=1 Tax=unclassified Snodgrassella TaxID=2625236 RepID=UPI0018DDDC75|nr:MULTISPECIES: hypothetical protein [unclassified Snodgrassella]MBI0068076.1 hypothetical protein [Snodgrassella sp. M0110]MBI0077283.1 hypothetical protein [Snodgrassella sp. M0118]MBI0079376.1 hypothetical protein [Snodgrassella sp. M0112]